METIKLAEYEIDFLKELLREHLTSKHSDIDTRYLANDVLDSVTKQVPDKVYEISLRTGKMLTFNKATGELIPDND